MSRILLSLLLIGVLPSFSQAGIMVGDWKNFGDGLLTIDTNQRLEFLDVRESKGLSYNDVADKFGSGEQFDGFRHATEQEVLDLLDGIGWTGSPALTAGRASVQRNKSHNEGDRILGFIGITSQRRRSKSVFGLTSTRVGEEQRYVSVIVGSIDRVLSNRTFNASRTTSSVGSFLVRSSNAASGARVVPEPSSVFILGIASCSLLGIRRRLSSHSNAY